MGVVKYNQEFIEKYIIDNGGYFLSVDSQRGGLTNVTFRCQCGNERKMLFWDLFYKKFSVRCKKCSNKARIETQKNKYGEYYVRTSEYIEKRRKTSMIKYGVDSPAKSAKVRAKYEKTMATKYGPGIMAPCQVPHFLAQIQKTKKEKYGDIRPVNFGKVSKECQSFFNELYSLLPENIKEYCLFFPKTHEFCLTSEKGRFYYDFTNTNIKLIIEYNGSKFHPTKNLSDDSIGWHLTKPKLTAGEARLKEKRKRKEAKNKGYKFWVVWDYEIKVYKDRKKKLKNLLRRIQKIIDDINNCNEYII